LGEDGKDASVTLNAGDAISIPTQLFRGFENVGDDTGFLWAVLGGDDPGRVLWAPYVFDMASDYGLVLLENGVLIDENKGEKIPPDIEPMPATTQAQIAKLQKLDDAALKKCCVLSTDAVASSTGNGWEERKIVHSQGQLNWPHEFSVKELRIEPGAKKDFGSQSKNQVFFVQQGEVGISGGGDQVKLGRGDTSTIAPDTHREITNDGKEQAVIVVVTAT